MSPAKPWSEYPEAMLRKKAMGEALEAAGKRKRGKRARSPIKRPLGPPTPHLVDTLEALRVLTEALGKAPSATQLGAHLGITRHGARKLLKRLEARGLARDVPKQVSSGQWAITPDGDRALELK